MITNLYEGFVGGNRAEVIKGMKFSFLCFLFRETIFFVGIFWAFLDSSFSPRVDIGGSWSPIGILPVNPLGIPLYNTVTLLRSRLTLTWAYRALLSNSNSRTPMLLTLLLALMFEVGQYFEYVNASFRISDGIYGSTFYFGTGFHGLHVIVGHCFLIANYLLLKSGLINRLNCVSLEISVTYWHFVDVVWLALYSTFYVWSYAL